MTLSYLDNQAIHSHITAALREDMGKGDFSTLATIAQNAMGKAQLIIKEKGILAGIKPIKMLYENYDKNLALSIIKGDGSIIVKGDIGFTLEGKISSILTTERVALNYLQRMSGIATYTHRLTQLISHTKAKVLDTRKTTPGFRVFEKWAVKIGGGENHRLGLFDMIMLKDNHIDAIGGIRKAIVSTQNYLDRTAKKLKIIVEVRTLQDVEEVLNIGGVHRILLDNMSCEKMTQAVNLIDGKFPTEASGNVTEKNIVKIAECGVDYISVGRLTHSAKSLNMSLKIV